MRRLGLVAAVLAAAGCSALRDAFSAHPQVAARAAGQTLSVERLAELAARVKGMPLEEPTLARLAEVYVDYALFAMAVARGRNLDDSATIALAMWPTLSQLRFDHFFEKISQTIDPTAQQVESTYAAGQLRAFQHILITVPSNAAPPIVQQKRDAIEAVQRTLKAKSGSDFAAVARRRSEDPGSRPSGGFLGVGEQGRFVQPFEDAAWHLAPGQMSDVVRTAYGFHIIRRPPLAEIQDTFKVSLARMLATQFDSTYLTDLVKQHDVRVAGDAPQTVRDALQDLSTAERSDKRLISYRGGRFTVKDFTRWLVAIDPRYVQQLATANDSVIRTALDRLIERELALQQAESTHVNVTGDEWEAIRSEYDSGLAILRERLQLGSVSLPDSAGSPRRAQVLMAAVDGYFDRVVGGQAEFHAVPRLLARVLREDEDWSVDAAGVRSATERAGALRARADSARPPNAGAPSPGLRPAPGPAPLGSVSDSARAAPPRP
jgi:hypothetical protein